MPAARFNTNTANRPKEPDWRSSFAKANSNGLVYSS
jgi:hypothetical protein